MSAPSFINDSKMRSKFLDKIHQFSGIPPKTNGGGVDWKRGIGRVRGEFKKDHLFLIL